MSLARDINLYDRIDIILRKLLLAGFLSDVIEKNIMTRIAAVLNRLTKIAKLIFAQSNDAFDNFFSLYQNRLQSYPPEQIAQKMLQEPIFTRFLERAIKTHLEKTYSTHQPRVIEDTAEYVFDNIVENLPHILTSYDQSRGLPLVGWLKSTINLYSKSINNTGLPHQKELPIDAISNENNMQSNAGGIINIPGYEYSQFLPQMQDQTSINVKNLQFQIENLYEKLYSDELENIPVARRQELTQAIKNQIADKKNRLKAYHYQQGTAQDKSQIEEYNRQQMVEKSVKNIPYEQLSGIIENQIQYKKGRAIPGENRFYPASSFFTPNFGNEELSKKMSRILIESMMRVGKTKALTNTKNNMFEARNTGEKITSGGFKAMLIQTLIQAMSQNQIEPEIQKQMLNHVENFNERELQHKPKELDEMTRMAYYTLEKNNMFPDRNWSELTDTEKEQISSNVQKQMEYGFGNDMAVRKLNTEKSATGYTHEGIDRLSRPTQNLTPEMRNQLMIQEINNISKGQRGYSVPATLPHNSPYFYKPKSKTKNISADEPEEQEIVYSPQAINQTYVNACTHEMQSIRTAAQTLIEYSEWCDKNELYHEAEKTQSMIRKAMLL